MKTLAILKYEWIHFIRSPFKIVALVLFILASVYGLHNGSDLFKTRTLEIDRIQTQAQASQADIIAYYDKNLKGPSDRPWVDVSKPFWALSYSYVYEFKSPSPLMVYGVGQAEKYGYYKRITDRSSPYDTDMAEEIANPERLQTGYLDFTFSIIYLLPLLLMIYLYTIKGTEVDTGILPLITVQATRTRLWLWTRISFYFILVLSILILLLFYGAILTDVFNNDFSGFLNYLVMMLLYLTLWTIIFGLIINYGSFSITNTLKMVGIWLLFAFIVPGSIHQVVSTKYPANLMIDFIDAQRDEKDKLYSLPDSIFQQKLNEKFPQILNSIVMKDSLKRNRAMNESAASLTNDLTKKSLKTIESSYTEKNKLIKSTYWFNPITFFQNRFNSITQTHFDDYQNYRDQIQSLVDKQIEILVLDIWADVQVDKERYLDYINILSN